MTYKYDTLSLEELKTYRSQLISKRDKAKRLKKKFTYTQQISKISDLIDKKSWHSFSSPFEQLAHYVQPGDILFFIGGKKQKLRDKVLWLLSVLPIRHVGIIGEKKPFNFYHSTGKTYGKGRRGVREVDLKMEVQSRSGNLTLLVARLETPHLGGLFRTAKYYKKRAIKYSIVDALTSILRMGTALDFNRMNCGDFVHECLKSTPKYLPIANPGVPCNLLKDGQLKLEYCMMV